MLMGVDSGRNQMPRLRHLAVASGCVLAAVGGASAALGATKHSHAATTTTTSATTTTQHATCHGSGTFKPIEDPAHEKGESAAREAQEDAGQAPTVP